MSRHGKDQKSVALFNNDLLSTFGYINKSVMALTMIECTCFEMIAWLQVLTIFGLAQVSLINKSLVSEETVICANIQMNNCEILPFIQFNLITSKYKGLNIRF